MKTGKVCISYIILLLPLYSNVLWPNLAYAQSSKFYKVPAGEVPIRVIPQDVRYRFADFIFGEVTFRNGQTASARLNYNLFYEELQFINQAKDTLSLVNESTIEEIVINGIYFYYDPEYGYLEMVADFSECALACKRRLQLVQDEELGSSSSIDGFYDLTLAGAPSQRINANNRSMTKREFYRQPTGRSLTLVAERTYYFMDFNNRWHPAQKSSLKKIFPNHQQQIAQYVARKKINFSEENDLIKLLRFGSQLE